MYSEIHVMIIWEKALWLQEKIINDLNNQFTILYILNSKWSLKNFKENLSKFYMKDINSEEYLLKKHIRE